MSTQSLDSDIYDYGFILNSTALHEAAMSVLVTTIYGRWVYYNRFSVFIFTKYNANVMVSLLFVSTSESEVQINYLLSIISLRHSVNGDFCGHSRFLLWHENLTTFVS